MSIALGNETSGVFYAENDDAYGVWEFTVWKEADSDLQIYLISPHSDDSASNTYRIRLSFVERIMLYRDEVTLFYSASEYITPNSWIKCKVIRYLTGEFFVYYNDVLVSTAGGEGTNPIIDNTYTTSINTVFSLNTLDAIRIAKKDSIENKLADMIFNSGTWRNIYLPEIGTLDAAGEEISNPSGKHHNLAETKFKLPAVSELIAVDNLLDTQVFFAAGVPNAVHPLDSAFGNINMQNKYVIFSFKTDTKFYMLIIYATARTDQEVDKIAECAIKKARTELLNGFMIDVNGDYMRDVDGFYILLTL